MHANLRKGLLAVAMIGAAPSAFADVIIDWNEKAVAFVTPRMVPAAGQRVVAIMQVAMFYAVNSTERRTGPIPFSLTAARCRRRPLPPPLQAPSCCLYPQARPESAPTLPRFPTATRSRRVSSSARRSQQRSWRRAPKMGRMRPMRTNTRPNPASMCRRRSRSPRLGRTSSHLRSRARRNSGRSHRSRSTASSGPPSTTRSRISAGRPAASVRHGKPKTPASGSSPGRRAASRSCAKSWRPKRGA